MPKTCNSAVVQMRGVLTAKHGGDRETPKDGDCATDGVTATMRLRTILRTC